MPAGKSEGSILSTDENLFRVARMQMLLPSQMTQCCILGVSMSPQQGRSFKTETWPFQLIYIYSPYLQNGIHVSQTFYSTVQATPISFNPLTHIIIYPSYRWETWSSEISSVTQGSYLAEFQVLRPPPQDHQAKSLPHVVILPHWCAYIPLSKKVPSLCPFLYNSGVKFSCRVRCLGSNLGSTIFNSDLTQLHNLFKANY